MSKFKKFIKYAKKINGELNQLGVNHVFIKSYRLGEKYYDNNLDVLIKSSDYERLKSYLVKKGYLSSLSLKEPDKPLFDDGGKILLHIHKRLSWNNVNIISNYKDVIKTKKKISINKTGLPVESDSYNLLINFGHILFENFEITPGEHRHLKILLKQGFADINFAKRIASENGWEFGFNYMLTLIKAEKVKAVRKILPKVFLAVLLKKIKFEFLKKNYKTTVILVLFPFYYLIKLIRTLVKLPKFRIPL